MLAINNIQKYFFSAIFIGFFLLNSCNSGPKEKMRIAVAANLQFAIDELTSRFTDQTGIGCEIIIGSSGKLTAQILEGAPYDVFMSADMKYPNKIFQEGFATEKPVIYAQGNLVLWTLRNDIEPELASLSINSVEHIAIGNPKTAPYGVAAMAVIDRLGIKSDIKEKLVFGESISQTNQFIISMAADIGFTSKAVVRSSGMSQIGRWKEIDKSLYPDMAQGLIIVKGRDEFKESAALFREFILSDEGKEILYKFGYDISI